MDENCCGDSEIEVAAGFRQSCWGEIDGNFVLRRVKEAGITDSGANALSALLDGFISHADNVQQRQTFCAIAFDSD